MTGKITRCLWGAGLIVLLISVPDLSPIGPRAVVAAQSTSNSTWESLTAKEKRFAEYSTDFARFSTAHPQTPDPISLGLSSEAAQTADDLDSARTIMALYEVVSCEDGRERMRPLIIQQLSQYEQEIDLEINRVNIGLSYAATPAVATTADRMKQDLRDLKTMFDGLQSSLR